MTSCVRFTIFNHRIRTFQQQICPMLAKESLDIAVFGSKGAYFEALIKHQVLEMLRWSDWNKPDWPGLPGTLR